MCNLWHNVNRINNLFASRHLTTIPIVSEKRFRWGHWKIRGFASLYRTHLRQILLFNKVTQAEIYCLSETDYTWYEHVYLTTYLLQCKH